MRFGSSIRAFGGRPRLPGRVKKGIRVTLCGLPGRVDSGDLEIAQGERGDAGRL